MSVAFKTEFSQKALEITSQGQSSKAQTNASDSQTKDGKNFLDHLKEGIQEINKTQSTADKMSMDLATGKNENIHETMLAMAHAELSFNFMVQVRNKALEAYQEVMRMPV